MALFTRETLPAPKPARVFVPKGAGIQLEGLTASATRVEAPQRENIRRLIQAWQMLALAYYDAIGEIHYCGEFYARAMQKVRFFVGERDSDGEIVPSEDEAAIDLWDRVHDPGGGRRLMMSRFGQLAFITGESLLMWSAETEKEEERWEIVSTDELRPNGADGYTRFLAPALGGKTVRASPDGSWEPVADTSIVYRLWKPHPRYSSLADSPMRGVLDLCKELLTLTQAVNAQAISHAARAGMLLVPEELSFPPINGGEDEDPDIDPFEWNLNQALMAAISDPASAAALAPMVVRGKSEFLHPDVFRKLSLQDESDKYPEENLRTELIRRIALGVDMPPEELLGKADVNHWTSWEISEDAWKHVEPIAWSFADSLATAYLRPTAREEKIKNWQRLCLGVDESAAVVKPDRGASANEVADHGGISLEVLRNAHDFADDDKMPDEEFQTFLAIKLNDASLLPEKWQTEAFKEKNAAPPPLPPGQQPEIDPKTGEEIVKGPPQAGKPTEKEPPVEAETASLGRMLGAAEMAVVRTREKAGTRARGAAQGCDSCKELIKDVPLDQVVATLGPETLSDLGLTDVFALVAGGADSFVAKAVEWGWAPKQAEALGEIVEMHAARNLFDEAPSAIPAGFAGHVRRGTVE
jgi:hypothetical protein